MSSWRIGAVSYLNTKPLVYDFARLAPDCRIEFDLPSRLADRLARGQLDVALIPSIEAIRHPQYTIVSDACIACRGPVWSVKLLSHVPLEQIRTVALDEGSRTSAVMVEIMLARHFGNRPKFSVLQIGSNWEAEETDAVLVIGDRAMHAVSKAFAVQVDMGQWWTDWVQLPFVFAMWAARPEVDLPYMDRVLSACRDEGLANLHAIAKEEAPRNRVSARQCLDYLTENLHFHLGLEEREGLDLFFRFAAELRLVPADLRLQFHDCPTT